MKFFKLFFSFGLPFGAFMGFYAGLMYGWIYGLFGGIAAGILFGSLMAFFTIKRTKKYQTMKHSLAETDKINFESYANYIAGFFPTEG